MTKPLETVRAFCLVLAGLVAVSANVLAQPLPVTPPVGYDKSGRYPAGTIQWNISYYSTVAGSNVTMHVYTPPGYTTSKKYGVIYCYQGIGAPADWTFADWNVYPGGLADNLIGEGKIKPVIIVAVDNQFGGTYCDVAGMTIKDAIPYVDSHYSTYADADHRGVYGYSWGGGHAFNVGCGNLDTFRYIAPSSAAPSKSGDDVLFPNGGAEAKEKLKLLLISCGNADYLGLYGSSEGAHNYCVANGVPHVWWPVKNGNHDSGSVWRPHMWNFLQMADAAGISDPPLTHSAYAQNEAENFDQRLGVSSEACSEGGKDIGSIQSGAWVAFNNVDFGTSATSFQARVASATSGGNIEVRLDSTNGTRVGTCAVPGTGGWQTWTTVSCPVSGATGIHTVFLRFTGGSGYLFNVNWWKFGGPNSPVAIPATPAGLVATARNERAVLKWNAAGGATGYSVKRASASGGPYTSIATVAGTNFTDFTAIGGTTYYYVVSAKNVGGESADSSVAGVTPTVDVPSPWLTRDIGAVGLAGWAGFTNGVFTVSGAGADVGGTSDQCRFAYVTNSGDCTIIARVASLEDYINSWSKAGVMIRESLNTNAPNAFIAVTPGNGVTWQYRSTTGGATTSSSASGLGAPYWVRLVRSGNIITGSYSANGTSWTQLGSTTITMGSTVCVGLAITSHNTDTLCTATFDRVTAPGWVPPSVTPPTGLTATAGVEQVTLKWTASANATSYNVKRSTISGGAYTNIATVTATNYTDTAVAVRTAYYYVVSSLNNLAGESGNSSQVSATPLSGVPLPWSSRDIGSVGLSGGGACTNDVFTVTGSGDDIWNTADAFRFVYVTNSSQSFTVIARVVSVQNVNSWSKAGVMIRQSLDANSVNAFAAVTPTTANGVTFQSRSTTGGSSLNSATTGLTAPYWVKLVRSGDTFTGFRSANGTNWTQMGSATLTNITTAYVGLAVTAHDNTARCSAVFDNVSLPGWPLAPLTATAVAASSTEVNLIWNRLTNATGYTVKRATTSGGPYSTVATGLAVTNYTDTVASVRNAYYYVVSAATSGGNVDSPEIAVGFAKLAGGIIGTAGSWGGSGNTIEKVFDGDLNTYFDAPDPGNGDWAGLDFGVGRSNVITKINYCPRAGLESRMVNGVFQGANQADFSGAVTLYTVTASPVTGAFTTVNIANTAAFRYIRYLAPDSSWGNVAELEFYGYPFASSNPPPILSPAGLAAVAVSSSQINLTWNAMTNASSFNVKRSTTNGGPYAVIATGLTATNHADSGLNGGTVYYYVVSAMVSGVETTNSAQASAMTQSPVIGGLVHRYSFNETGGTMVGDSMGGPVWNGTLPNGGTLSGGRLTLSPASQQYASLPSGVMGSMSNFTIMAWVNLTGVADWSRVFDFWNNLTTHLFLTPQCGGNGTVRFEIMNGGVAQQINCDATMSTGVWHQVAVTLTGATGVLYVDGVGVGTNASMTINPSAFGGTTNNYIGKSEYANPYLDGALEEFRIYNAGLTSEEVAAANVLGPGQLLGTNSPVMNLAATGGTNLVFSWPVDSAGYTLQYRTNLTKGGWMNVPSTSARIVSGQWQVNVFQSGNSNQVFFRLER